MIYLTPVNPDILLNGVLEKEVNLSSDTYGIYLQVYIYIYKSETSQIEWYQDQFLISILVLFSNSDWYLY